MVYSQNGLSDTTCYKSPSYCSAEIMLNGWKIPKDYDYYLKKMYGNYLEIPALDDIERHALLAFSLNDKK